MNYYIATAPTQPPTPQKFEDTSITIGAIFGLIILVSATVGGITSLIKLTIAANNLKNSFEQMDTNIAQKLGNVSERVDGGFSRIDREWTKLDRRITYHDLRIDDIELFLHKHNNFAIRKYYPTESDRLGDSM